MKSRPACFRKEDKRVPPSRSWAMTTAGIGAAYARRNQTGAQELTDRSPKVIWPQRLSEVEKGDVFGLVGESGSGKTTTGKITAALLKPTNGQVLIDGTDIYSLERRKLREFRRNFQFVFQDPLSSLNPKMTVGDAIAEPLRYLSEIPRRDEKTKFWNSWRGLVYRQLTRFTQGIQII